MMINKFCFTCNTSFMCFFNFQESLFYTVPPTAMETYRKSIESYFVLCEVNLLSYICSNFITICICRLCGAS